MTNASLIRKHFAAQSNPAARGFPDVCQITHWQEHGNAPPPPTYTLQPLLEAKPDTRYGVLITVCQTLGWVLDIELKMYART